MGGEIGYPISPTLTWTGLGTTQTPTCMHAANAQSRDVVWCAFPDGLPQSATVEAVDDGIDRTFSVTIR